MEKRKKARRIQQFKTLDLMGVKDIAEALDWSKAKVVVYTQRGKLPEPIGEVSGRPVWLGEEIKTHIEGLIHHGTTDRAD